VNPGLTTVKMPIERCGALAVELLLQVMAGATLTEAATLGSQLIVRGTTAAPSR
jgi:LacI family transcriptional regulator